MQQGQEQCQMVVDKDRPSYRAALRFGLTEGEGLLTFTLLYFTLLTSHYFTTAKAFRPFPLALPAFLAKRRVNPILAEIYPWPENPRTIASNVSYVPIHQH